MRAATALLTSAALLAACAERGDGPEPAAFAELRSRLDAAAASPASAPVDPETRRAASEANAVRGFVRRAPAREPFVPPRGRRDGAPGEGEITLDFQGADLAGVVEVMMEEGLGEPYVLDPRVRGTVTLRTNRPLAESEILPVLEEILRLNNAAIVEQDGLFRILPRAEAGLAAPIISARDARARGLTVRVTPLRFVGVDDISGVLEGFAPVAGSIRYDRARNLVFVTGTEAEQATLMDLIATLDVNALAGRSVALRPLEAARPAPVIAELNALFGGPQGQPSPVIRFLPIQRMQAVLVITEQQVLLEEALALIGHLDQGAGEAPSLHVFAVNNRRAGDLAVILGEVFDAEVSGDLREDGELAPDLEEETRSTADLDTQEGLAARAEGAAGASLGAGARAAGGGSGGGASGVIRIVADDSSNAMVALATSEGAEALQAALARLDVQPLQVMIEATLVEVQLNDALEYGVRWFLQSGNFNFAFSDIIGGAATAGASNIFPGFNAAFRTDDIQLTLSALDTVTDLRVLSSPTLMVLDTQSARLQVGDVVPITTRSSVSVDDPDAPLVQETEFRDTGVILEITPSVNAGGLVVLEILQQVSDTIDTPGDVNPTFATRTVESTVAVQSGETVALAGLIEEDASLVREGIPFLSRIPVLGSAFGTTRDTTDRTELLVLIRPLVIRDQNQARAATEELRQRLIGILPPVPEAQAATAR